MSGHQKIKHDYEAIFVGAMWYDPDKDPYLPDNIRSHISFHPYHASVMIDIEGQHVLLNEDYFNDACRNDHAYFIYIPPFQEDPGLIDPFEWPEDLDLEHREGALIVHMKPEEVKKARHAINDLKNNFRPSGKNLTPFSMS